MQYSDSRRKIQHFKQSIRRQQINRIFAEQRELLMQNEDNTLALELKSNWEKQKEFLDKCSLYLTGDPNRQWLPVIHSLHKIIHLFDGEFDYWFTCNIIKSLCIAIKQADRQLKLAPLILQLFCDMICLASQKGTLFIEKLVQYQITLDAISVGVDKVYSVQERIKALNYCSQLCYYDNKYIREVIRNGGGVFLVMLGQQILSAHLHDTQICKSYLSFSYFLIKNPPHKNDATNLNVISKMISITTGFIFSPGCSSQVLALSFSLITAILSCGREFIFRSVYQFNGLLRKLVSSIANSEFEVRFNATHAVCSILYTENSAVSRQLVDLGLIDEFYKAWKLPQSRQNNYYIRLILNAIGNLVDSFKEFSNSLVEHKLFEIVIDQIQSYHQKNKVDGFYTLNTIVCNLNANSLHKLIVDYDLLRYLMIGLSQTKNHITETTGEILSALKYIVELSSKIYPLKENSVIGQLEGMYRITSVLEEILHNSKSQIVYHSANQIHSLVAGTLWNTDAAL